MFLFLKSGDEGILSTYFTLLVVQKCSDLSMIGLFL